MLLPTPRIAIHIFIAMFTYVAIASFSTYLLSITIMYNYMLHVNRDRPQPISYAQNFAYYAFEQNSKKFPIMLIIMPISLQLCHSLYITLLFLMTPLA